MNYSSLGNFTPERLKSSETYTERCVGHAKEMQESGYFKVIAVDQTKYGETMIIYRESGENLSFYIGHADAWFSNHEIAVQLEYDPDEKHIYIYDIQMKTSMISRGYGTMVMKFLKMIADKHEVATMTGRLYYEDQEHRNRQVEYYSKNGFEIKGDSILWKRIE